MDQDIADVHQDIEELRPGRGVKGIPATASVLGGGGGGGCNPRRGDKKNQLKMVGNQKITGFRHFFI